MQRFSCPSCRQEIFFRNTACLACGAQLRFDPDTGFADLQEGSGTPCANREVINCNWTAHEGVPLCLSCLHTTVVPDLSIHDNRERWERIETAKRPLILMLHRLRLPLFDGQGAAVPRFELKGDPLDGSAPRILTGHANGTITLNIAEADDAERERIRSEMNEPYRTLTGHLRHEVAHHYWDVLTEGRADRLGQLREVFGDERQDYAVALQTHYAEGPPPDWPDHFISAYATAHPWEDFAESWAHVFHLLDGIETAQAFGLLTSATLPQGLEALIEEPMSRLTGVWVELVIALNAVNQALGHETFYPFVLAPAVVRKQEAIRALIREAGRSGG
ncbi:putative zinc-binding metallopeptidase [Cereibacter azotoformans]|uniref:zinc-binding metallopeptidase family protein n=1 Tax=Cereibacter azotoformans TaxID=43057 RepID=UPI000C6D12E1|nr:putative zinc-binding metallopeptidase [Cereibacter azotoformans]